MSSAASGPSVSMGRLRQMCRRGTLELDVVLERWLETGYLESSPAERGLFVELLALEDDALQDILLRDAGAPPAFAALAASIRQPSARPSG